jgi:hypothetical protein
VISHVKVCLDTSVDARMLVFSLRLSIVAALVAGLSPALLTSALDMYSTLKDQPLNVAPNFREDPVMDREMEQMVGEPTRRGRTSGAWSRCPGV